MTTTKQLSNFGKTTVILSVLIPAAHAATLSEVPVYQHFADDCFGLQDPNGGAGDFVVHKDCENYNTELWERPYEADKFDPDSNDSTMLSNHGGEYYAYADITKAAIGWNDEFPNDTDHGVEYDTVALAIPEPSVAMLSAVAALALFGRRRKN